MDLIQTLALVWTGAIENTWNSYLWGLCGVYVVWMCTLRVGVKVGFCCSGGERNCTHTHTHTTPYTPRAHHTHHSHTHHAHHTHTPHPHTPHTQTHRHTIFIWYSSSPVYSLREKCKEINYAERRRAAPTHTMQSVRVMLFMELLRDYSAPRHNSWTACKPWPDSWLASHRDTKLKACLMKL